MEVQIRASARTSSSPAIRVPSSRTGVPASNPTVTVTGPGAVTFVPTYVVVSELGGINTLWGIVVPGLFSAFATFLFRQFYLDFPVEIEEAGRLDGLSHAGIYWRLVLPNSIGVLAALGIAGEICVYTNSNITLETLPEEAAKS